MPALSLNHCASLMSREKSYFFIAKVDEIVLEARLCREFLGVNRPVTHII